MWSAMREMPRAQIWVFFGSRLTSHLSLLSITVTITITITTYIIVITTMNMIVTITFAGRIRVEDELVLDELAEHGQSLLVLGVARVHFVDGLELV